MDKARARRVPPRWRALLDTLEASALGGRIAAPRDAAVIPFYVIETRGGGAQHQVRVGAFHRAVRRDGQRGGLRPLPVDDYTAAAMPHAADRTLARLLIGLAPRNGDAVETDDVRVLGRTHWSLDAAALRALLPLMFETGRLFVLDNDAAEPRLLRNTLPATCEFALTLQLDADERYRPAFALARGDESLPLERAQMLLLGAPGLCIVDQDLCAFQSFGCDVPAILAQAGELGTLSRRDAERFVDGLLMLPAAPRLILPEPWSVAVARDLAPRGQLHLSIRDQAVQAEASFVYGDRVIPSLWAGDAVAEVESRRQIIRDRAAESALQQQLYACGFHDEDGGELAAPADQLPEIVRRLSAEGWALFAEGRAFRRPGAMSIQVSTGIDWFDVNGAVDFDGLSATLPELLKALQQGRNFVRLGDGSLGMLPEEWLKRCGLLMEFGEAEGGTVRFKRSQALLLDELLSEREAGLIQLDDAFRALRTRLREFDGLRPLDAPRDFHGELRPYQQVGLAWFQFLDEFGWGGCLADDMGLGKTVQVLAWLLRRRADGAKHPSLAVVPRSVVFNWMDEAARFAPQLRLMPYHGPGRHARLGEMRKHDLVVTTYHTLRNDIADFAEQPFDYAILDEAQAIKNPRSQAARAVRLLKPRRRLALSGTPIENRLGDLWSLLEFLNPGMLGTVAAFQGAFEADADEHEDKRDLLRRAVRPFVLRRTKEDVASDLPAKTEETIQCVMTELQQRRYDELRQHYRGKVLGKVGEIGLARSKIHVLEALLRLRQAACHPALLDANIALSESGKFDALLPMLDSVIEGGHKALIFSQFVSYLSLVRRALDERGIVYEYLDGKTKDRRERVGRFQSDPDCRLFLISLKAGGLGLNLTAADYVFILDPWWNPAVEAQAIDRTHRIGQDKRVFAYRLIAQGTVEEKILELQSRKRDLAAAIITESSALLAELTQEDLEVLLS